MSDHTRRIVDTAVELAEAGGFEAVRLRDVAAKAGVALGTVYKRFPSKEDILVAALERVVERLEKRVASKPATGDTALERVNSYFKSSTRALCRKPNLTRALLRSVVSGERDRSDRVLQFHGRSTALIVEALAGTEPDPPDYLRVAIILQHVWFASLVGWMSGITVENQVVAQVGDAAELLLSGLAA